MRPHLEVIQNTMKRKQQASEVGNDQTAYLKYLKIVEKAREAGMTDGMILDELQEEYITVYNDEREGDAIFQQGVANAKNAHLKALKRLIKEIKGETDGIIRG